MSKLFSIASALRLSLIALVLVAAGFVGSGSAHAALTYCRTDPVLTLSNGATLTLTTETPLYSGTAVTGVNYSVYLPAGVSISKVTYDNSGVPESVSLAANNQAAHTYAAYTEVFDTMQIGTTVTETAQDSAGQATVNVPGQADTSIWSSATT